MTADITRIITLALILALALPVLAKDGRVASSTEPGRVVVPLDGTWRYAVDQDGQAPREVWAQELPTKDTLELPYSWQQHDKALGERAAVWYSRDVTLPGADGPVAVRFNLDHPVGLMAVYFDDRLLATLPGNGLPQQVVVHDQGGSRHRLTLRLERGDLPATFHRAAVYGLGHMSMELLPPARVETLSAVLDAAKGTLTARYRVLAGAPTAGTLKLEVVDPAKKRVVVQKSLPVELTEQGIDGTYTFTIKRMLRWSPTEPEKMYLLRATLQAAGRTVNVRELTCGACEVTYHDGRLRINGQPIRLKGLRFPGGIPLIYLKTLEDTLRRELKLAKEAGFNAIMADGSALPEDVLAAADSLGMLVVGEVPVNSGGSPEIRATVEACAHHPSVIAWSWPAGDEKAIETLRALDPARPALLRDGLASTLLLPHDTAPRAVACFDQNYTKKSAEGWWELLGALQAQGHPALVTGIGIVLPPTVNGDGAGLRGNSAERDEALRLLREMVEGLRRNEAFPLLGYFVRLPEAETMTGLSTPSGIPTNAFTTSQALNQSCAITLRTKTQVAPGHEVIMDAAIVNEAKLEGEYRLYLVATTLLDGKTSIISHDLTLTGDTVQDKLHPALSFIPTKAGEYRLQVVLAKGDEVVAATQIVHVTVK